MNKILARNIIATITYYDVLDYPLSSFEIWKHLINAHSSESDQKFSLNEVIVCLADEDIFKYLSEKNGFYFLCGREGLVNVRRERERISLRKIKRLRRIVSFLRVSPFVRMMCVTGRLAYKNCEETSDLDLLIVYKYGHIWTGRFFLTIISHIFGVRRYGEKTNDRVCLNYHITTESLCVPTKDLFAAHEYFFAFPLYDYDKYFENFCVNNNWIETYKPQYSSAYRDHVLTMGDNQLSFLIRSFFEMIFADKGMEDRLRKAQEKKIKNNPKTDLEGALILHSNYHLVFLPKPHGPHVFEEYKKRLTALEVDF